MEKGAGGKLSPSSGWVSKKKRFEMSERRGKVLLLAARIVPRKQGRGNLPE